LSDRKEGSAASSPRKIPALAVLGLGLAGIFLLLVVYLWWGGGSGAFRGNTSSYNVLLVTLDTTRADHLAGYAAKGVRTPAIDGLANRGVLFENAYTPAVMTLPSHASILTGLLPPVHGVRDNATYMLRPEVETMTEALRAAGYRTGAAVGAVVLDSMFGLDQGFELYDDNLPESGSHDAFFARRDATMVTDAALSWLSTVKGSRWFLWAHYFDAHAPYRPPRPFSQQYQNPYDAEIAYMDSEIGRLLAGIRDEGSAERTIVVLVADHGEGFRDHGEMSHGVFLYDETARVPLVISVPGYTEEARRVRAVVRTTDIMPTVLDLLRLPPRAAVQGKSLWPLMSGKTETMDLDAYSESTTAALSYGWSPMASLRSGKWKLIYAPHPELYDMDADPGERRNLAEQNGAVVEEIKGKLQGLLASLTPSAGPAAPGGEIQLDADEEAKMRSLGYVGGSGGEEEASLRARLAKSPDAILGGPELGLADPKDQIPLLDSINRVAMAYGRGEFRSVISLAGEFLAVFPENDHVRQYEADSYRGLGEYDKALDLYRQILSRDPGNLDALLNSGWSLMGLERLDEARDVFEKALEIHPGHVFALSSLGDIAFVEGDYAEAAKYYREILLNRPNHLKSVLAMAKIFEQRGLRKEAKISYRRATELAPRNIDAWLALGFLQFSEKDFDGALETLASAGKVDPNMPELNLYRGDILLAQGKLDQAEAEYQQGIRKAPQFPQGYHGLGLVAAQRGDSEKAREYFLQALQKNPSFTPSREQLRKLGGG